ncbi:hypothetical protein DFA_03181 [Cavenderia fasciculata]|uniref:Uncharacterized protein n=1 Tax=Cavenderia fasciculata TaxID=261658 RepID=F4PGV2_CACFS|nr:uncharacterized protein DFA_03181 [Cavenderia fasciculata]EGG24936.1 hypothetical protein DFA_03181 [Cavenderia fasciculata]|eukprot:XP_004362787.1 hypothetical protein DFA_03181 [Cavenderia fasciculata]
MFTRKNSLLKSSLTRIIESNYNSDSSSSTTNKQQKQQCIHTSSSICKLNYSTFITSLFDVNNQSASLPSTTTINRHIYNNHHQRKYCSTTNENDHKKNNNNNETKQLEEDEVVEEEEEDDDRVENPYLSNKVSRDYGVRLLTNNNDIKNQDYDQVMKKIKSLRKKVIPMEEQLQIFKDFVEKEELDEADYYSISVEQVQRYPDMDRLFSYYSNSMITMLRALVPEQNILPWEMESLPKLNASENESIAMEFLRWFIEKEGLEPEDFYGLPQSELTKYGKIGIDNRKMLVKLLNKIYPDFNFKMVRFRPAPFDVWKEPNFVADMKEYIVEHFNITDPKNEFKHVRIDSGYFIPKHLVQFLGTSKYEIAKKLWPEIQWDPSEFPSILTYTDEDLQLLKKSDPSHYFDIMEKKTKKTTIQDLEKHREKVDTLNLSPRLAQYMKSQIDEALLKSGVKPKDQVDVDDDKSPLTVGEALIKIQSLINRKNNRKMAGLSPTRKLFDSVASNNSEFEQYLNSMYQRPIYQIPISSINQQLIESLKEKQNSQDSTSDMIDLIKKIKTNMELNAANALKNNNK